MPSVPEFRDGQRFVWGVKVKGQFDIEHFTDTDCHITITAEVEVNLDRIREHDQKGGDAGQPVQGGIAVGHQIGEAVGDEALFGQSEREEIDTLRQIVIV